MFDLLMAGALIAFLMPTLLLCALAILILEGRPVIYVSRRRVYREHSIALPKFRTMRRDAERIANRDTVPVSTTRFLNIPKDSPLYTRIGGLIERLMLTELPQLVEVLRGRMSLVGNRPLPENVIDALREDHPEVEGRFLVPAGLTGPVQLVGRDFISDGDRLRIEIAYCCSVAQSYSVLLDCKILFYTVVVGFLSNRRFTPEQALQLVTRSARVRPPLLDGRSWVDFVRSRSGLARKRPG